MKIGKIVYKGKTKKGKEILVRYPKNSDVEVLRDYINRLSKEQTFITLQGEQISFKEEKKYLYSQLNKIKKRQAVNLLVFSQDLLIAETNITMFERTSSHIGSFGITVAKAYRGEGIGKMLLELVLAEAKKHIKNLRIVSLGCFANNKTACAMYKNSGFKEYGRLPAGIKHRGEFVDHVYYYKNI